MGDRGGLEQPVGGGGLFRGSLSSEWVKMEKHGGLRWPGRRPHLALRELGWVEIRANSLLSLPLSAHSRSAELPTVREPTREVHRAL